MAGTKSNDIIKAGEGSADIDGGTGSDELYAGSGTDTFTFEAKFGRDTIYGYTSGTDHFDVSVLVSHNEDITLSTLNGGADTLITFAGTGSDNKIILHDVAKGSLSEANFGLLI